MDWMYQQETEADFKDALLFNKEFITEYEENDYYEFCDTISE